MKYLKLQILADLFYKLATIKFPAEEAKWVPEQLKEHKLFKDYPQDTLQKVFKDYGLDDFRIKVEARTLRSRSFSKVYSVMKTNLINSSGLLDNLVRIYTKIYLQDTRLSLKGLPVPKKSRVTTDDDRILSVINLVGIIQHFTDILEMMKKDKSESFKLFQGFRSPDKSIKYDAGASIIKVYNDINNKLAKIQKEFEGGLLQTNIIMRPIENSEAFSTLSKSQQKFELVFSTNLMDLVGISDRGISSCQSLHDEATQCSRITEMNQQLIGTILSRFIGVCYITSGKPHKSGRGEEMLYRALIRQVFDLKTNKPVIFIDNLYPAQEQEIYDIMQRELQKQSPIPVVSSYDPEGAEDGGSVAVGEKYYMPEEEDIPEQLKSYQDVGFSYTMEQLRKMKNSQIAGNRQVAANRLPLNEVEDMIWDSDEHVREAIIERLVWEKKLSTEEIYKLQTGDDDKE